MPDTVLGRRAQPGPPVTRVVGIGAGQHGGESAAPGQRRGALILAVCRVGLPVHPHPRRHADRPSATWAILQPGVRGPCHHRCDFNARTKGTRTTRCSSPRADGAVIRAVRQAPSALVRRVGPSSPHQLPWLRRTFARGIGMAPGRSRAPPRPAGPVRAGILICFEDILPRGPRGRRASRRTSSSTSATTPGSPAAARASSTSASRSSAPSKRAATSSVPSTSARRPRSTPPE